MTDLVRQAPALISLAGPANRQGRIAADNILGRKTRYASTQGTAICKVFDLAFAMTGASEGGLVRAGRPYRRIYVHPTDHATYYPGAQPFSLKLLFDAQAVGTAGVGVRGYVAARLLVQHGFRARNLSGGYRRYLMWKGTVAVSPQAAGSGSPSVALVGRGPI